MSKNCIKGTNACFARRKLYNSCLVLLLRKVTDLRARRSHWSKYERTSMDMSF